MRLAMGGGESDECSADIGIRCGCARRKDTEPRNAVAAGWSFGGEGHQPLVGGRLVLRAGTDDVAKLAQREACGLGHSHDMPAAGHGVAESVETAKRIADGRIGGGENHAGGADGGADRTGLENSHAHCACTLIACAGNDGRASDEAGDGSGGFADCGADVGRLKQLRQPLDGNSGGFGHGNGPAAMGDVEQQCAGGFLHIHGVDAAEAEADIILGQRM